MDKDILKAWDENQEAVRAWISTVNNSEFSYELLLENTLKIMFPEDEDGMPDSSRITKVDNGHYQGTLVFVIGGKGYQPAVEDHWYTSVGYGSCSGCDTLEGISHYSDELPSAAQIQDYWTLCLHMVQKMKRMTD